jgi:preprotein translocase subunit SecD
MSLWKLSPWLSRLIILAVAALFSMISLKFILDPLGAATASGITIQPGLGYTNTRAGFGGFPLGFALILLFCLFSSRWLLAALASIATVAGVILLVRLYAAVLDNTFSDSAQLLAPEAAITIVALLGAWMESARRAHDAGAS